MLPSVGPFKDLQNVDMDPKELVRSEAIIGSMTAKERKNHEIINGSRRRRIARGSGVEVQDVNALLKQYREARRMMRSLTGGMAGVGARRKVKGKKKGKGRGSLPGGLPQLPPGMKLPGIFGRWAQLADVYGKGSLEDWISHGGVTLDPNRGKEETVLSTGGYR